MGCGLTPNMWEYKRVLFLCFLLFILHLNPLTLRSVMIRSNQQCRQKGGVLHCCVCDDLDSTDPDRGQPSITLLSQEALLVQSADSLNLDWVSPLIQVWMVPKREERSEKMQGSSLAWPQLEEAHDTASSFGPCDSTNCHVLLWWAFVSHPLMFPSFLPSPLFFPRWPAICLLWLNRGLRAVFAALFSASISVTFFPQHLLAVSRPQRCQLSELAFFTEKSKTSMLIF